MFLFVVFCIPLKCQIFVWHIFTSKYENPLQTSNLERKSEKKNLEEDKFLHFTRKKGREKGMMPPHNLVKKLILKGTYHFMLKKVAFPLLSSHSQFYQHFRNKFSIGFFTIKVQKHEMSVEKNGTCNVCVKKVTYMLMNCTLLLSFI
jgi:hypothetical protein